jgi:ribokinase
MPAPKIFVLGSSNTDMVACVPHIPAPGETILSDKFAVAAGGKGANQAVGAARAGGRVSFLARVGDDYFGRQAVRGFVREGIDVRHIVHDAKAHSGVALIFVAGNGENSIAVAGGANSRVSINDVRRARRQLVGADTLLMQLEVPIPAVRLAARYAVAAGIRVILNPAPARPLPDTLLRDVSILTPNESEASLLTGIKVKDNASADRAAERLLARGVGAVILTLGRRGAWVACDDIRQHVTGFRVRAVDTTAAGDIFNAALAVALGESRPMLDAVRFANAAAALSVTRHGSQSSAPTRDEIDDFIRRME